MRHARLLCRPADIRNSTAPRKRSSRGTCCFRSGNLRIEILSLRSVHVCQSEDGRIEGVAFCRAPRFDANGRNLRIV